MFSQAGTGKRRRSGSSQVARPAVIGRVGDAQGGPAASQDSTCPPPLITQHAGGLYQGRRGPKGGETVEALRVLAVRGRSGTGQAPTPKRADWMVETIQRSS